MKVVILAGGLGTRLAEETIVRPKPMVEIGGRPMLWHIMKIYAHFGLTDFVVCLGYKGYMVKEYFANWTLHRADVTIDLASNSIAYHDTPAEPWRVTLAETGDAAMTGGRLRRAARHLAPGETFCLTYGDGVADIDIAALLAFHRAHGRKATVTVVRPPGRFGAVALEGDSVTRFIEKPQGDGGFINGGFFVLEPSVLDEIEGDATVWEAGPLERLAATGELRAFRHDGFWQPMDTLRDKAVLEEQWRSGRAPWAMWP
jgi:glucose-1-phosphate cytidylyltransferase